MRKLPMIFTIFMLSLCLSGITLAQEATAEPTTAAEGVSLTVYNTGSALVQDRRVFSLTAGDNILNFTNVAATIDATSVSVNSLTDPSGTYVIEQNYVYDLVDTYALLERYLDQVIQVTALDGTIYTGQLLSGRTGDIILKKDTGEVVVISISEARDIQFPELPSGLITRPTLRWLLNSATGGDQTLELTYLANGISWTSDYILLLAQDNSALDLNGWITLTNTSGTAFEDAKLKLIAGDVNRLPQYEERGMVMEAMAYSAAPEPAPVEQRSFSEYKLYEIPRPVTVGNNETKQVQFVNGTDVPAQAFYVYDSSPDYYFYGYVLEDQYYGQTGITDVQSWMEFTTDAENGLGADLPAGRVRVYQEDIDGAALLIGENSIDHTPEGEDVRLLLGNAFDLVGERTQTNYNAIAGNVIEETYQITLRNRKDDQAVEIRVPETLFRWGNWEITESSMPFTKLDSNTVEFRPTVEPDGEVVITYTVRYTYPR